MLTNSSIFLLSLGSLAAIITTDLIIGDRLFEQSLDLIPSIQSEKTDASLNTWHIYSDLSIFLISRGSVLIVYAFITQRSRCFYYLFVASGIEAFVDILKLAYHEPRPYWVDSEVIPEHCSGQYGNPSGHAAVSMAVMLTIWLDLRD